MATIKHLCRVMPLKSESDIEPRDLVQNFPGPVGFQEKTSRCMVKLINQAAERCS